MGILDTFIQTLQGKTLTIIGMGVSNYPLISLLLEKNIPLTIRDKNPPRTAQEEFQGATFLTGETYLDNLTEDIIFRTPGLSPLQEELVEARKNKQLITSEMQEFFKLCPCHIFAVTGSDGKTTTTTLISQFLKETGKKVFLGGNIGNPLLCQLDQMSPEDFVVVELSSFQLMDLDCQPEVAVLTNISPNHLDYHKDMGEYVGAKINVFLMQTPEQSLVLNMDNPDSMALLPLTKGKNKFFSRCLEKAHARLEEDCIYLGDTPYLPLEKIQLKGVHNIENYMAAILAVEDYCSPEEIQTVAESFTGVQHRMQLIRELHGVRYYNDSIGTSPTRTIAGLRSFDQRIILIAGGYDKGIPFTELGIDIRQRVKHLVLVGDTSTAIATAVEEALVPEEDGTSLSGEFLGIYHCDTLTEAVVKAKNLSEQGDNVVLSPACAAFDQFKNFAQRGEFFEAVVKGLF